MLRRLTYFRTASFWGGVLMFLGLVWAVVWLGLGQPSLVCLLSEGLVGDYPGNQAHASSMAHRRARQIIFGWRHEDGWWMGYSAAKEDVPAILNTRRNKDFDDCSSGHRGEAMELITNHQIDGYTRDDWKKWWEDHSHQTQAEWMMAGFKAKGIEFSLPPDHSTCLRLLKLIGRGRNERKDRFKQNPPDPSLPDYIVINLRRVLYCHGFDASKVTKEEIASDPSGEIKEGLQSMMNNAQVSRFFHDPFEEPQRPISQVQLSGVLNPATPWIHTLIAFLLFQSGFFLWLRARFRRRSQGIAAAGLRVLDGAAEASPSSTPVSP